MTKQTAAILIGVGRCSFAVVSETLNVSIRTKFLFLSTSTSQCCNDKWPLMPLSVSTYKPSYWSYWLIRWSQIRIRPGTQYSTIPKVVADWLGLQLAQWRVGPVRAWWSEPSFLQKRNESLIAVGGSLWLMETYISRPSPHFSKTSQWSWLYISKQLINQSGIISLLKVGCSGYPTYYIYCSSCTHIQTAVRPFLDVICPFVSLLTSLSPFFYFSLKYDIHKSVMSLSGWGLTERSLS